MLFRLWTRETRVENPYIEVRSLDRAIANEAQRIQRESTKSGWRMPRADSVHIATTIALGIKELNTFDDQDIVPHNGRWGKDGHKLVICHPRFGTDNGSSLFGAISPPKGIA